MSLSEVVQLTYVQPLTIQPRCACGVLVIVSHFAVLPHYEMANGGLRSVLGKSATKVLALASGGGHWVQLRRMTPAFEGVDVAFASVYSDYAADVAQYRYYVFDDVNRFNKMKTFKVTAQIVSIIWRERPDTVITTGAGPGLIAILVAKYLFGCKTIWVDSVANCERLSGSGKVAGRFSDVWLTQWEHLSGPSGPEYWGSVL